MNKAQLSHKAKTMFSPILVMILFGLFIVMLLADGYIDKIDRACIYLYIIGVIVFQVIAIRNSFLSPLFIIAVTSIVLYDIIPVFLMYLWGKELIPTNEITFNSDSLNNLISENAMFISGQPEVLVVVFSLSAMLINMMLFTLFPLRQSSETLIVSRQTNIYFISLYALSVITATIIFTGNKYYQGHSYVSTIKSVGVTNILFIIALTLIRNSTNRLMSFAVALVVASVLVMSSEGKKVAFFVIFMSILYLSTASINYKKIILYVFAMPIIISTILMNISSRYDTGNFLYNLQESVLTKIFRRQIVTNKCFAFVVDRHWDVKAERTPLYFLEGLVPRFVWKDKPNISNGNFYDHEYCENYNSPQLYNRAHSASITLLGEPLLRAGKIGLLLDTVLLIIALGWFTKKAWEKGPIGLATMGAMTPWLVDFDQDFTLYVANAVKFFLCLLPLVLLAHSWEKRLGIKHEPAYRPDS